MASIPAPGGGSLRPALNHRASADFDTAHSSVWSGDAYTAARQRLETATAGVHPRTRTQSGGSDLWRVTMAIGPVHGALRCSATIDPGKVVGTGTCGWRRVFACSLCSLRGSGGHQLAREAAALHQRGHSQRGGTPRGALQCMAASTEVRNDGDMPCAAHGFSRPASPVEERQRRPTQPSARTRAVRRCQSGVPRAPDGVLSFGGRCVVARTWTGYQRGAPPTGCGVHHPAPRPDGSQRVA